MERNRTGILHSKYHYPAISATFDTLSGSHQYPVAPLYRMERLVSKSQSKAVVPPLPDRTGFIMVHLSAELSFWLFPFPLLPRFHHFSHTVYRKPHTLPIFTLPLLLPKLSEGNQVARLRQEINSIKSNEKVFETLLSQQPFYI